LINNDSKKTKTTNQNAVDENTACLQNAQIQLKLERDWLDKKDEIANKAHVIIFEADSKSDDNDDDPVFDNYLDNYWKWLNVDDSIILKIDEIEPDCDIDDCDINDLGKDDWSSYIKTLIITVKRGYGQYFNRPVNEIVKLAQKQAKNCDQFILIMKNISQAKLARYEFEIENVLLGINAMTNVITNHASAFNYSYYCYD